MAMLEDINTEANDPQYPGMTRPYPSVEEFIKCTDEPASRVIALQWHRVPHPGGIRLLSHSFLVAAMADGRRLRLEKTLDEGPHITELRPEDAASIEGKVYRGRHASMKDLLRPVFEADLHALAAACGSCPYSLRRGNCHHFVRDVWNSVVVASMRKRHYPDRFMSNLLRGVTSPLHAVQKIRVADRASSLAHASLNSDLKEGMDYDLSPASSNCSMGSDSLGALDLDELPEADGRSHPFLSMRQEEAGRTSGFFVAHSCQGRALDKEARSKEFTKFLESKAVRILESASSDLTLAEVADFSLCDSETDQRLSLRVSTADVTELASRLPARSTPTSPSSPAEGKADADKRPGLWAALTRSSPAWTVNDLCFVVLRGREELRLAIYAVLKNGSTSRRLRMLSGSAQAGRECAFHYSVRELQQPAASAAELAEEELEALRTALATNEWGFITLL
eukprot:TRINITY_DN111114_c0_g1_i1.p1 TRINITY_DN111114_c0_g1~~TRINITY_DN111114_c0_g1_i1.p1  ORF type:complete len:452 (-),score=77.60 TRINITY_DN111114_c0_g1_i1:61-1416(-)